MSTSAGASGGMESSNLSNLEGAEGQQEAQQLAATMARFWWAWIVAGILWIAASVVILQFNHRSINVVGIVVGIMFLVAGLQEFVIAFATESGWRWLWATFGVLLLGGGIWALFNPTQTFFAMANIVGFVFLLVGIGWTLEAFATMSRSPLAWIGIVSGIIMIGLGFWAASQLLVTQAYTLLVFAGIWALLHGITDIVKAFMIRQIGKTAFA